MTEEAFPASTETGVHSGRSVTLISNGESMIYGAQMFWNRRWADMVRIGYNTVVIQDGDRCILVNVSPPLDGSIAREFPDWLTMIASPKGRFKPPPHGDLFKALESQGIQREDVTDIVITPFQLYSTGTLLSFPKARIHFSKRGWANFHVTKEHPHDDRWRSFDRQTLADLVTQSWDRVVLLEDEDEVVPGVRTWWSGGHHRESIVVEIESTIGVIAVSDTFFCADNILEGRPIGLAESLDECLAAHDRIRESTDHWVSIHDAEAFGVADAGIVRLT